MNITIYKKWLWTTLATATLTILSLAPIPDNPPMGDVPFIDKWVHFVMYGGLVCAAWLDRQLKHRHTERRTFALTAFLYATAVGGLMELLQSLTTYRSGEWLDFYADTFGALLATAICLPLSKFNFRK
jgi:VanZ family protein